MQLANKATTICREYGRSFYAWKINLSWRALLPFDRLRIWSFFSGSNSCENKQRQRLSQKFHVSLDTKRRTLVASQNLGLFADVVGGWMNFGCLLRRLGDIAIFRVGANYDPVFPFFDRNVFAISNVKCGGRIMNQSRLE